jgi:hypothetical protein
MFDYKNKHVKETGLSEEGLGARVARDCVVRVPKPEAFRLTLVLPWLGDIVGASKAAWRFRLRSPATVDKSLPAAIQGDFGFFHSSGNSGPLRSALFRLLPPSSAFFRGEGAGRRNCGLRNSKTEDVELPWVALCRFAPRRRP